MKNVILLVVLVMTFAFVPAHAETIVRVSAEDFEQSLNTAIEDAYGETLILLPEGTFSLSNELIVDKPLITLRGMGKDKTILSFKNQKVGPQGIIATRDQIAFEDFGVEDTFGNAIKVIGSNHVSFKRLKVRWTRGPSRLNGAYGLYPVLTRNVLIEECEVSDASDAGIYVGQSTNIIVRRNKVFKNVAGIEIENSDDADVYENEAYQNTAGILVFNLPDLIKKDGRRTRIHHNKIFNNNLKNFSTKGSIINLVPKGMGVFILAAHQTQISQNTIQRHSLAHIAIAHYALAERPIKDPSYDPMPRGISIFANEMSMGRITSFDGTKMNFIIKFIAGLRAQDVIYDGISDGTYSGEKPLDVDRICIGEHPRKVRFSNLHLDNQRRLNPLPGGPVSRALTPHACKHPELGAIVLEEKERIDLPNPPATVEEIKRACTNKNPTQVNWQAVEFDCPELSNYNLFKDPKNPTQGPREGFQYFLKNQLFTDYSEKDRFIFLPPGTRMGYTAKFAFDFPVGTIITKTFSLNEAEKSEPTLMETRLLIHRKDGWKALNYLWNTKTQKATLLKAGLVVKKSIVRPLGIVEIDYHVPSLRQCASCHMINGRMTPIGPQAQHLNTKADHSQVSQLQEWAKEGKLEKLPTDFNEVPRVVAWTDEKAPLDQRSKAYLEMNCAHCHNPKGAARNTGLFLQNSRGSESIEIGVCKTPVAAGLGTGGNPYSIFPGSADRSILMYRMTHSHLAVKMPQLGRSIVHEEANQVIRDWINQMPAKDCVKE